MRFIQTLQNRVIAKIIKEGRYYILFDEDRNLLDKNSLSFHNKIILTKKDLEKWKIPKEYIGKIPPKIQLDVDNKKLLNEALEYLQIENKEAFLSNPKNIKKLREAVKILSRISF